MSLPNYPRKRSAPEIVDEFRSRGIHATLRTVERDLESLSTIMPIGCDTRSRPYGWFWSREAQFRDSRLMTPETALIFQIANAQIADHLPPTARNQLAPLVACATEVLSRLGKDAGVGVWSDRVRVLPMTPPLIPPKVDDEVFETVQRGILEGRCLHLKYESRRSGGMLREYEAHPLGLVFRNPVIYLVAMMEQSPGPYVLAAHRIQGARLMPNPSRELEDGFDLDALIARGLFDYPVRRSRVLLELLVTPDLSHHLSESRLSEDQVITPEPDGRFRVRATVLDGSRILWWLRSLGSAAEIMAPKALRDRVQEEVKGAAARYQS